MAFTGYANLKGGGGVKHTDWYFLSIFQRSELERNLNDAEVALKRNRDNKSNRKCNEHEVTTNWSATQTHMVPTLSDPPIYVYRPINEMWLDQLWQRLKNGEVKNRSVNTNVVRSALITRCQNRPNHILLIGRIVISKNSGIFHVHRMFCLFVFNCLIRIFKTITRRLTNSFPVNKEHIIQHESVSNTIQKACHKESRCTCCIRSCS